MAPGKSIDDAPSGATALSISKTYSIDSIKNIIVNPIPSFIFFTSFLRLYLHNGCERWEKREGERKGENGKRKRKRGR
jgi:hypothetical protein